MHMFQVCRGLAAGTSSTTDGGVSWDAEFAMIAVTSHFEGRAISDVIMANIAFDRHLTEASSVALHAGLGLSVNRLSAIVETDVGTGIFLSDVAEYALVRPAARISIDIE